MADNLQLETEAKPSLINKEMVIGGLLGAAAGLFAPVGASIAVAAAAVAGAGIIAGLAGGLLGRQRMLRESAYGKKVSETTSGISKETFLGGALGLAAGVAAAVGIASVTGDVSLIGEGASVGANAVGALGSGSALAMAGAMAAVSVPTAAGTMLGRNYGKYVQKKEFEQAHNQHIVKHVSANASPDIAQAVGEKLERDPEWAKKVRADQLAGQQAPERS